MFGLLKKRLKESVQKLVEKTKADSTARKVEASATKAGKRGPAKRGGKETGKLPQNVVGEIEEVKKEVEHIEDDQTGELIDKEDEEAAEEVAEEGSEEELESAREPLVKTSHIEPEEDVERELRIRKPAGRKSFAGKIFGGIKFRALTEKDVDGFFAEMEVELLDANVAVEVVDFIKQELKKELVGKEAKRLKVEEWIRQAFEEALIKVVDQGYIDFSEIIRKAKTNGRPAVVVFLGFNGSGKTTSIAKVANFLKGSGLKPVMAAGDTFRAAAIQQLEVHGERIGVKVIKHDYGADPAAVIFDAVKHAEAKGMDAVLADTAGRMHTNTNLVDELKKIVRVNKPDLKVLVVDSLTGNDAVEQARRFNDEIGVDAVVLTKVDVNEKGGAILSVAYSIKKPIIFLGIGQEYKDFKEFNPKEFVAGLLE